MNESLDFLVEEGILTAEAMQTLQEESHIQDVGTLYRLMKSFQEYGDEEMKQRLSDRIGVPYEKWDGFLKYIHPYVTEDDSDTSIKTIRGTGCLFTKTAIEKYKKVQQMTEEERTAYYQGVMRDFYAQGEK